MTAGAVQVNARGERFHDETQGYSEAAIQVLAQPGGIAWNVYDDRLLALAREFRTSTTSRLWARCAWRRTSPALRR